MLDEGCCCSVSGVMKKKNITFTNRCQPRYFTHTTLTERSGTSSTCIPFSNSGSCLPKPWETLLPPCRNECEFEIACQPGHQLELRKVCCAQLNVAPSRQLINARVEALYCLLLPDSEKTVCGGFMQTNAQSSPFTSIPQSPCCSPCLY